MNQELEKLYKAGQLTPYLYQTSKSRMQVLPVEMQADLVKEASNMSKLGINSPEDHKTFFYILRHARQLSKELTGHNLHISKLSELANLIFTNREKLPINTIFNFYRATAVALNKMQIPIKKLAYPQGDGMAPIEETRDVQKWMQAMRDVYALGQSPGYDISKAFKEITANWDKMEQKDFKSWMSFYEENAHNKYKTAQDGKYYQFGPGTMIPMDHLRAKLPSAPDMAQYDRNEAIVQHQAQQQQQELETKKREDIKKKIKAIISRLNAAERLATDPEVQKDLQKCLDVGVPKWLEELQRVKRLVQLAPIKSSNSTILEDLIIRQANILQHKGFPKTAQQMRILAQEPPSLPTAADPGGMPEPPAGGAPEMSMTPPPDLGGGGEDDGKDAIDELIEGMNNDSSDTNDVEDMEDDPLASITVMAQAVEPQADPAAIEVEEEPQVAPETTPESGQASDAFEAALANVTITDVINRLEALANIFRNREISRELAIVDLMMDRLGIATYFPSLAEANSKSLESNQYALTRIEDILSKLRGSVETPGGHKVELAGPAQPTQPVPEGANPETVKQNLAEQELADKARKERRKEIAEQKETAQPAPAAGPVTNVPEELAQPAAVVPTR